MSKNSLKRLLIGEFSWRRMLQSFVFVYISLAIFIYFRADSMIFLPQPASYQDSPQIIKLTNPDGTKIAAYHLVNSQAKYTILYAHGNAEDLGDIKPMLEQIYANNLSIFAYDYRGYGISEGRPSEQNAYEDIQTAYNYLTQTLKIPADRIIVFGRSVGGGSAVDLAVKQPIAGLILESTFTSAFRVKVPFPVFPFDKFSNLDKIKHVNVPVLVMHGQVDEVIPFDHSQKLYAAVTAPKMSLWIENANHNDFNLVAGDRYNQTLQEFIRMVDEHN